MDSSIDDYRIWTIMTWNVKEVNEKKHGFTKERKGRKNVSCIFLKLKEWERI